MAQSVVVIGSLSSSPAYPANPVHWLLRTTSRTAEALVGLKENDRMTCLGAVGRGRTAGKASDLDVRTRFHFALPLVQPLTQTSMANCRSAVKRELDSWSMSSAPSTGFSSALTWTRRIFDFLPARSTATNGLDSSTLASVTPAQLVSSVPSMSASVFSEPAVASMTLAPAADAARLTALGSFTVRFWPALTVRPKRWKPPLGET